MKTKGRKEATRHMMNEGEIKVESNLKTCLRFPSLWNFKVERRLKKDRKRKCTSDTLKSESNASCHGECVLQNNKSRKRREGEIWAQLKGEARPWALIFSKTLLVILEHQSYKAR